MDLDKFWDRVWTTVFHLIGLGAVIGGTAGFVWLLFQPQSKPGLLIQPESELSASQKREVQSLFNSVVIAPVSCAKKRKNISNLDKCEIFLLKPGMPISKAEEVINNSGYFKYKQKTETCKNEGGCSRYISAIRDGFYVRVEALSNAKGQETISRILLSFSPNSHPYFDPNYLFPVFEKILGPHDKLEGGWRIWGQWPEGQFIRTYVHERSFWVTFEGPHNVQPSVAATSN